MKINCLITTILLLFCIINCKKNEIEKIEQKNELKIINKIPIIKKETIQLNQTANNKVKVNVKYDISVLNKIINIDLFINTIPAGGVTVSELQKVIPLWKEKALKTWSNMFAVKSGLNLIIPINVNVSFTSYNSHHNVIVKPGAGKSDEFNWNIQDNPGLIVHEIGHMLGAFDEYKGGSLNPDTKKVDLTSIMGKNVKKGESKARHFWTVKKWYIEKTGLTDIEIVKIKK